MRGKFESILESHVKWSINCMNYIMIMSDCCQSWIQLFLQQTLKRRRWPWWTKCALWSIPREKMIQKIRSKRFRPIVPFHSSVFENKRVCDLTSRRAVLPTLDRQPRMSVASRCNLILGHTSWPIQRPLMPDLLHSSCTRAASRVSEPPLCHLVWLVGSVGCLADWKHS